MNIKTFVQVISALPPHIAVLAKGPTGIGKSDIFKAVGNNLSMPVIDRRLSQMTEGDIIGLPELTDGITRFAPVDWFVRACNEPVVLFFDELNRATIEVQQCAFQIVLDRELNGHKLHPETRVYTAINEGSEYQVTDMDPALLRRFFVATLEPTTEDWLVWAEGAGVDDVITSFIKKYPTHLRHDGELQPGKVYPNPASWDRLGQSLCFANMAPSDLIGGEVPDILFSMCTGFIGTETAVAFTDYVRNYEIKFCAEDVLNNWKSKKSGINKLTNDKKNDLLSQIVTFSKDVELTLTQAKNACAFAATCSDEILVNFMNSVMETKNIPNIRKVHKHIAQRVVEIVNAAQAMK
jgi:hypothetical protein